MQTAQALGSVQLSSDPATRFASDRLAHFTIPDDNRLALIRNADRFRCYARLRNGFARCIDRPLENFIRIVLHPPRFRKMLRDLPITTSDDPAIARDYEACGAGRSFVDC